MLEIPRERHRLVLRYSLAMPDPLTDRSLPVYAFRTVMRREPRSGLVDRLRKLTNLPDGDTHVLPDVISHAEKLVDALMRPQEQRLQAYSSFLPPRMVNACRDATLIPFFGSGISIPAGIPSWTGLLERLGLATDYISDPHVEHDALTHPTMLPAKEAPDVNQGFVYARLHELSRRDTHIAHVVQNIVPIGFDDDVHEAAADLRLYSMVAAIGGTRWKLALSKLVPAAVPRPNTTPRTG